MLTNNERVTLFKGFTLDLARGCVLHADRPVHLRPQSYEVLKYLVENKGRLISKDKLIEEVWQGRAVTDGSLGKCIEEVREALGPEARQYVRNVRGRGYIFDPAAPPGDKTQSTRTEQIDFVRLLVEDEEAVELEASVERRFHRGVESRQSDLLFKKSGGRTLALMATGVVLISATVIVAYTFFAGRSSNSAPVTSIAVLPLVNESGNSDLEYLSEGVSESLINSLSQLPQLKVIARSSAFEYKGKGVDLREVSRALGVQAVLMGRVAQHGDNLLVSVELVDARDRAQLWGERYTRKSADLQGVQEDITRTISEKLRLRLTGEQEQQLTRRATQNPEAYELYLNGLFYYRKPGMDGITKSLDYFEKALVLDRNFAPAWVEVARVNDFLAGNSLLNPKEPLAKAKAAVQRALALDETLPDAHLQFARIKRSEWDWAGAEQEYKRAIALNPNLAEAHGKYSSFLSVMGRHAEALAENKRAQDLDPLRIGLRRQEAFALLLARRYDEAVERSEQTISLEQPTHGIPYFGVGLIYGATGRHHQAIAAYQKAISIMGETTSVRCYLGSTLAMAGRKREALSILSKLKTTQEYVSPAELAVLYVGLDDKESAIASLERAYAVHDLQLENLKVDPQLDSLRTDPRFQNLLRRVGLP